MAKQVKRKIPTTKITIGSKEDGNLKEVEVYKYLTQEQENEKESIIYGENKYSLKAITAGEDMDAWIDVTTAQKVRGLLVRSMCVNVTEEEVNEWHPRLRKELFDKLDDIVNDDKKK